MKDRTMELKDVVTVRRQQRSALETYAWEVFDQAAIARLIDKATAEGRQQVRVLQDVPVNLSETEAAKALVLRLAQLGYRAIWESAGQREVIGKRETGRVARYSELIIAWDGEVI
ncbi:MAG: hypothetical protein C0606_03470 [Hyphomicrobiales bacterium]|nr:MAG: hypothetical protein C0606_03470 [Hyphomicrobiales bacterium]